MLALLAAPGPAAADLTWSKPEQLTPPYAADPKVAIDARGLTLLTWGQRTGYGPQLGRFSYRWRTPGGRWSPIRTADGVVPDFESVLRMTPHGDALVAYGDRDNELVYRTAPAGGTFSRAKRLGDPGEKGFVDVATDDAGNAVAAWSRLSDGAIRFASRRADGDFGPAQTLEVRTGEQYRTSSITRPAVAMNTAGAALIAWQIGQEPDEEGHHTRHRVAYRPPAGSFGTPELAPRFGSSTQYQHALAMTESGDAVMTSQDFVTTEGGATTYAVRRATGGWSDVRELGRMGFIANLFAEPGGAVSFVVSRQGASGSDTFVDFVTRLPDGTLVGPNQISAGDGHIPHAAMSLRGDLIATWVRGYHGMSREGVVAVADRLAGAAFQPEVALSPRGTWSPHVALNDARQAAIAWDYDADPAGEYAPAGWGAFRFDPEIPPLPLPPEIDIGAPLDPVLDGDGIAVPVECDRDCTVLPGGLLVDAASDARRSKKTGSVKLRKGARRRVRVRFGAADRTAAREALASGRRPWVSLTVRAKGKSPRPVRVSRRVKLR